VGVTALLLACIMHFVFGLSWTNWG
jgi:hypothetical protein